MAFYGFGSGAGGVPWRMISLMNTLLSKGFQVDLLLNKGSEPDLAELHPAVRIVEVEHKGLASRVFSLSNYLRRDHPEVLLTNREYANRAAVLARNLAHSSTRVIFRVGTTLSLDLSRRSILKRLLRRRAIGYFYPRADSLIAVSHAVAADTAAVTGVPLTRIHVAYPFVMPQIARYAQEPVEHPWFAAGEPPVVLAVGRLVRAKDFPTLVRAFAMVRDRRSCRLVILGEGKERLGLMRLADQLGVKGDMDLPGHADNPFAYMDKARLLVLSSSREGCPNVLVEALAVGVPIVATDCESGPREILQNGRYGQLVPVGDTVALAEAILETLEHPPERAFLQNAARLFRPEIGAKVYLEAVGIHAEDVPDSLPGAARPGS